MELCWIFGSSSFSFVPPCLFHLAYSILQCIACCSAQPRCCGGCSCSRTPGRTLQIKPSRTKHANKFTTSPRRSWAGHISRRGGTIWERAISPLRRSALISQDPTESAEGRLRTVLRAAGDRRRKSCTGATGLLRGPAHTGGVGGLLADSQWNTSHWGQRGRSSRVRP